MNGNAPHFFIPEIAPENFEPAYAELARWCSRRVPTFEERIYSITFVHDGEEWVAAVGQKLEGKKLPDYRRRTKQRFYEQKVFDPAVVLAIFPGYPYLVATNHRLNGRGVGSNWENPFLVGQPKSVVLFSSSGVI